MTSNSMRIQDIPHIERLLDHLNSVQNILNRTRVALENHIADPHTAKYEVILTKGRDGLTRCSDRLASIKGIVSRHLDGREDFPKELMRVILMKADLNMECYECSICLSHITMTDSIWSCSTCFNVLHLVCVKQHASVRYSSAGVWNCPICRHEKSSDPNLLVYKCFCGAITSPEVIEGVTAHGCGRICRKTANCSLECHPAACHERASI